MKIIINARDADQIEELEGLLNGFAKATGNKVSFVKVSDSAPGRGNKIPIAFEYDLLLLPLQRIEGLLWDRGDPTKKEGGIARFQLDFEPKEYALLNALHKKKFPNDPLF